MTGMIEAGYANQDRGSGEGAPELTVLKPGQEGVGVLEEVTVEQFLLVVRVRAGNNCLSLAFPADSAEANEVERFLTDCPIGCLLGLIATDSKKHLLLREIRMKD